MRKFVALILCVLVALFLFACQNSQGQIDGNEESPTEATESTLPKYDGTTVFTFPEGTVLCGVDLSGKLGNRGYAMLKEAVQNYRLDLDINGQTIHLTGKDMSLAVDEEIMASFIAAIKNGEDPSAYVPVTYNAKQLQSRIAVNVNVPPQNVSLQYDPDQNEFIFTDSKPGTVYDLEPEMDTLKDVILTLSPTCTISAEGRSMNPSLTADTDRAQQAQRKANNLLRTALTYGYTPEGSRTTYEALTIDDIGSFYCFDDNLNASIDVQAVNAYAARMKEEFSVGLNDGKFLTSLGEYIDFDITYADQLVDETALAEDIIYCLENGISGVRTVTYLPKEKGLAYDLGGNYAEVNLTEQCLWIYNNYECVMYTPIVSGCLANNWATPNGAFAVVYKDIGATLMGLDVTWWMPFYLGYGLHDAPWRSVFDNDEYLFNGSHGCVNIPPANMRAVFNNMSWHTPVIVYGGANNGNPVQQELYVTTEYNVGLNAGSFELDAMPKYGYKSRLTYTCDNTDVVTVSRKGVVTVVGAGTAKITVETPDWDFCPSVKTVVTVTVHESCSQQGHMVVDWKTTQAPTCSAKGYESGNCTSCGISVSREIDPCHDFGDWEIITEPTCTAEGQQERICSDCGTKETEVIPASGHRYFGWVITEPTPTRSGKKTATCYDCHDQYEEILPAE